MVSTSKRRFQRQRKIFKKLLTTFITICYTYIIRLRLCGYTQQSREQSEPPPKVRIVRSLLSSLLPKKNSSETMRVLQEFESYITERIVSFPEGSNEKAFSVFQYIELLAESTALFSWLVNNRIRHLLHSCLVRQHRENFQYCQ